MTDRHHTHASLDFVSGLGHLELDRRLVRANDASGLSQRIMAFYLFDMDDRRASQLLGFKTARHYAMDRLGLPKRRANELICSTTWSISTPRSSTAG
jgi:hypothetical protein